MYHTHNMHGKGSSCTRSDTVPLCALALVPRTVSNSHTARGYAPARAHLSLSLARASGDTRAKAPVDEPRSRPSARRRCLVRPKPMLPPIPHTRTHTHTHAMVPPMPHALPVLPVLPKPRTAMREPRHLTKAHCARTQRQWHFSRAHLAALQTARFTRGRLRYGRCSCRRLNSTCQRCAMLRASPHPTPE